MSFFQRLACCGLLSLTILTPGVLRAQEAKEEILARGPIHEAFAEPIDPTLTATPIIPKQPPGAIDELPPDQKPVGDNVQWIPGYWNWDEERKDFIWISGFWRVPPPNKAWMPGSWREARDGWQWTPGFWTNAAQQQAEIQYLPQPPAVLENGPATPAPMASAVYVPGVWVYRDGRYLWRAGYWIENKAGWIWIPAHYRWTPAGYVYIDGYWDHPIGDRGMLFAPVYIPRGVYVTENYYYTPTIVVREQCMYGALFVRRGYGCYYFGDYFDAGYADRGFVSWGGCRGGREVVVVNGWYDPMYSYYRVTYREDPYWRTGVNEVYVGRFRGDIAPPPRTLIQQTTVVNNITINNTVVNKTTQINNVSMLTPLSQVEKTTNLKMQPVALEARQQHLVAARKMNEVAIQRTNMESKLMSTPNTGSAPRTLKLDMPKTAANAASTLPKVGTNPTGKLPGGGTIQIPASGHPTNPTTGASGTVPHNPGIGTLPHIPSTGTLPNGLPQGSGTQPGMLPKGGPTTPGMLPKGGPTTPGMLPKGGPTTPGGLPKGLPTLPGGHNPPAEKEKNHKPPM